MIDTIRSEVVEVKVNANRLNDKPGSLETLVAKHRSYEWNGHIWILYNSKFEIMGLK